MKRLYQIYKERLKFYILIILIVASVIQLGILWGYQNQGLPFNFMSMFTKQKTSDENPLQLSSFLSPYKIIISEEFDGPKLILNKKNPYFSVLWKDAKTFIKTVFKMKSVNVLNDTSSWYDLANKSTIIFDFETNIQVPLLKSFLDISETQPDSPEGIYKMIISPWEYSTNYNNAVTVYINDSRKIYKYDINLTQDQLTKLVEKYTNIISDLNDSNSNSTYYSFLKSKAGVSLEGFSDDTTLAFRDMNMSVNSLESFLPYGIGTTKPDTYKIASKILGPKKDNYIWSFDQYNTIELKTVNNIYKIYPNGYMEYNYLPTQSFDRGDIREAFGKAFEFVSRAEMFSENKEIMSIYLSGIKVINGAYQFSFDYMVSDEKNDIPIFINYNYTDENGKNNKLNNAIQIIANSRNVISLRAVTKGFKFTGKKMEYGIGPSDIIYRKVKQADPGDNPEKNVAASYELNGDEGNKVLDIVWAIKNGDNYYTTSRINK